MLGLWIFLGGIVVVIGIVWHHGARRASRRADLRLRRLSEADIAALVEVFPLWRRIPKKLGSGLRVGAQVFLAEKSFEACGGLERVTREMRVTIAIQACLLIANRPEDYYERLKSILIYPGAYKAVDEHGEAGVRLGESWGTGSVVLGWKSVLKGGQDERDGHNVVMHEFAHQLDQEDGVADGVPELSEKDDYGRWSRAFAPSYEAFCERVNAGKRTVLDEYGATNPAEFFAVATETFFEKAVALKREEPEVYRELVSFYEMDPGAW